MTMQASTATAKAETTVAAGGELEKKSNRVRRKSRDLGAPPPLHTVRRPCARPAPTPRRARLQSNPILGGR